MFDQWFATHTYKNGRVAVLTEADGGRDLIREELATTVADHLVDLEVIEAMGGFDECRDFIINRMPVTKRARSGDLGEVLATEFVESRTEYRVPIRRLRYKDDRNNAMRGDDVVGIREQDARPAVLKAEVKSRVSLSDSVLREARGGLAKNQGRPNPGTLAFIQYVLAKERRFDEARLFKQLQDEETIEDASVEHLLFTLSGNDPTTCLMNARNARKIRTAIHLGLVGLHVGGHAEFVEQVFNDCLHLGGDDGNT